MSRFKIAKFSSIRALLAWCWMTQKQKDHMGKKVMMCFRIIRDFFPCIWNLWHYILKSIISLRTIFGKKRVCWSVTLFVNGAVNIFKKVQKVDVGRKSITKSYIKFLIINSMFWVRYVFRLELCLSKQTKKYAEILTIS